MNDFPYRAARISEADLLASAHLIEERFTDRNMEANRTMLARDLLGSAFALERALRAHTRCALVNHYGTRGSNNLHEATQMLFDALLSYAATVSELASHSGELSEHGREEHGVATDLQLETAS